MSGRDGGRAEAGGGGSEGGLRGGARRWAVRAGTVLTPQRAQSCSMWHSNAFKSPRCNHAQRRAEDATTSGGNCCISYCGGRAGGVCGSRIEAEDGESAGAPVVGQVIGGGGQAWVGTMWHRDYTGRVALARCVLWREGRGLSYHIAREVHEELGSVTQDEAQLLEYGVGHELLVGVVSMAQNNGELL